MSSVLTSCFHLPLLASSSPSSVPPSGLITSSPSYPNKLCSQKKKGTANCQEQNLGYKILQHIDQNKILEIILLLNQAIKRSKLIKLPNGKVK